ncbi:MAG: DbpA RNA binding domain-containing protein, partial [Lachnospiraceae bacterium]|nr:DbpA RNA binding domain-containing protein [Lachnospiraceae bacterium]
MQDVDLSRILHIVEKKLLHEDYTSLELAAALLRMNMGEANQDIVEDGHLARSLDDLGSYGRDGRGGRGSRNYRGGKEYGRGSRDRGSMERLFLNIGREHNVKPGDILGAIAGESGVSGRMIGSIEMYDNYTFVEVPADCTDEILEAMRNVRIRGKNIRMEKANRKS